MLTEILLACNLALAGICYYIYKSKTITKLKTIYVSKTTNREIGEINGVFEIHITVDHTQGFMKLIDFSNNYEKMGCGSMKVLFAVSHENNNQYMISHFTRKQTSVDAIIKANKIAEEMKESGIIVKRVKVEAIVSAGTQGIPLNKEEYKIMCGKISEVKLQYTICKPYFEFHVKVNHDDELIFKLRSLFPLLKEIQIAISCNIMSRSGMKPLLTLRMYDMGLVEAQNYKDLILNTCKNNGYILADQIQEEFSIYDSFVEEDKGWITSQ